MIQWQYVNQEGVSPEARGVTFDEIQVVAKREIPAGRFGNPVEFGAYAAFLCSEHCGFVTGQNLMIDGAQYPGLV
ncbi:MAG: SDR family oxidoreductase [Gammaproteobacteria bacterium]|nr:SDR family oxidoreductase [Gammaproteobacteria bacterium]